MRYIIIDTEDVGTYTKILSRIDKMMCVIRFPNGGIPSELSSYTDYSWASLVIHIGTLEGWYNMTLPETSRDVWETI